MEAMAIAETSSLECSTKPHIIDIRKDGALTPLVDQIRSGLNPKDGGEKKLPTLLLYNEQGLKLFEKITYLEEYYPTGQEIEVLERYADHIADRIAGSPGSMIVELGSGNLRKVKILLDALDRKGKDISYFALDLSPVELERTLAAVPDGTFQNVKCFGLLGTYDDGLAWLKKPTNASKPKTILSLGSSIGNFDRTEAAQFISQFADVLTPSDTMLLGIDACTDSDKVYHAYNDREGLTHKFILNGLKHANELMGYEAFNLQDWKVIGKYNQSHDRHEAFVSSNKDLKIEGASIRAGEEIRIEESWKYNWDQSERLWTDAHVSEGARWVNDASNYALHLINRPKVFYPTDPEVYAQQPVPAMKDWQDLWAAWDSVTRHMLPDEELLDKPIKLRNACIFYLGHIPTFMDIHLTRSTRGKPTQPGYYTQIFERGIDPDVDDPAQCHAHSEVPDSWPPTSEVLEYQARVRERIEKLYTSGHATGDGKVSRALWLGYEHEIMHLETLLYMLVQSEKTLPPPGTIMPDFEALAAQADQNAVANEWFTVPAADFDIGLDDSDDNPASQHYFGWDNERPKRPVHVPSFRAQARPITNGEFADYMEKNGITQIPASWVSVGDESTSNSNGETNGHTNGHANGHTNGETNGNTNGHAKGMISHDFVGGKAVRTVYGAVPLKLALHWPVAASYDELLGCAKWMGGRIPSLKETRSIYRHVEQLKEKEIGKTLGRTIPAVNGHLVNNGVQETPPSMSSLDHLSDTASASSPSSLNPHDLFIDLHGVNVGFKHWHPMPVTQNGNKLSGQADMGGVWEWTSTVLDKYDGFEAMELYPGYTADFFDGKHNIVLGGSWATHPRIAGRKSFINWYQRNYPYVWAGARLVKDT